VITTVTLNPCVDLSVWTPNLSPGDFNITTASRVDVAGKGVNVSVVLRELSQPTLAAGISFDGNHQQLAELLETYGIAGQFVLAHGNLRTNIKIYDERTGDMTELTSPGEPVGSIFVEQYLSELPALAAKSQILVFSGRIPAGDRGPAGSYEDIYRRSLRAVKKHKVKTIVDAEGKPLREAIRQKPTLIKPNLRELQGLTRKKLTSKEAIVAFCRESIIAKGVETVCVSLGGDGALIVDGTAAYYAPPLTLAIKGLAGAGDSMVAGIAKAMRENRGADDMLRFGVAAASASLLRPGTLLCRRADYERLLKEVRIEEIS
jgi:1-phosphofructokinase